MRRDCKAFTSQRLQKMRRDFKFGPDNAPFQVVHSLRRSSQNLHNRLLEVSHVGAVRVSPRIRLLTFVRTSRCIRLLAASPLPVRWIRHGQSLDLPASIPAQVDPLADFCGETAGLGVVNPARAVHAASILDFMIEPPATVARHVAWHLHFIPASFEP